MGFIDRLKGATRELRGVNPMENPAVSLASPVALNWITGSEPTEAGELVNERNALETVTVMACIRVLAESVASLRLKLYEVESNGRSEALDSPLYDLLAVEPNPEMSAVTFWENQTGVLALTGNCYASIQRNSAGQPIALWPLHPLVTTPFRLPDGTLAYKTSDGEANGKQRIIPAADMLHTALFSFDGLKGLSPIALARQTLGAQRAVQKFGARWFGNGSRPGGILSRKAPAAGVPSAQSEKNAVNVREQFEAANAGKNQGRLAILNGDWTYQSIGVSPEESQFLMTLQHSRTEIAAIFRVPPHMVGDISRLSNANHEQQQLSFVVDTLRPYLSRFEAEISRKLLPSVGRNSGRFYVQWDVSDRLRGDFDTVQKGFQTGVLSGWISRNEVRKQLGMNPGPSELDVFMTPVNMQNAHLLLTTESIQDQAIGTDDTTTNDDAPTQAERSILAQYRTAYLRMFTDAVDRTVKRDKRDYQALSTIFQPILRSILDASAADAQAKFGVSDDLADAHERILKDALKSIEKRASTWTAGSVDLAGTEFTKIVRSLHTNVYREAAASIALQNTES